MYLVFKVADLISSFLQSDSVLPLYSLAPSLLPEEVFTFFFKSIFLPVCFFSIYFLNRVNTKNIAVLKSSSSSLESSGVVEDFLELLFYPWIKLNSFIFPWWCTQAQTAVMSNELVLLFNRMRSKSLPMSGRHGYFESISHLSMLLKVNMLTIMC